MTGDLADWHNQVAVVTGGARGLGRAAARLFAQHGAAVCVNYARHAQAAEQLVDEVRAAGGRAIAVLADVTDAAAIEAMIACAESELGPVTILVNNAGLSWQATLDGYDRDKVAHMRRVNVEGVIHATRAVMAGMRTRRYGVLSISARLRRSAPRSRAMPSTPRQKPKWQYSRGALPSNWGRMALP